LQFFQSRYVIAALAFAGCAWLFFGYPGQKPILDFGSTLPIVLMSLALVVILFAFASRRSALIAWTSLMTAHLYILAAILFNSGHVEPVEILFYASGVILAFLLGYHCLHKIDAIDGDISLDRFHGYVYEQNTTRFLFLVAAMGILGFPITAAFVGIDVMFTYVQHDQYALIILMALCFIFIELTAFRILLRIFYGPHKKLNHPVAFRSS